MNISGSAQANAYMGMQKGFDSLANNAKQIADPNNSDLTKPLIGQMMDKTQVEVNAKSFKNADDRIGTLLDLFA
ncbi:hypothetical protein [Thiosulfativibrio zosterae]|uniref:Flagellar basal-body/hook protein C-terminal domain-containing protein n=1 Tax=Thiosulfativibrio zosterae TaxID=2675053 RepID=A0A6F8PNT6_9GAMM|nr:hypothetical protein [Thiosulfativibrio zosterae]BBP43697.1 hypothetical protein THMIRHAT_14430 [Thiosulfativibrio zosterae]